MNLEISYSFTESRKKKPSEEGMIFGKVFTDHMFVMDYSEGEGWTNPAITAYSSLLMEPAAMVFHYGQACFEGMKAYCTTEGKILLFRPEENFKRLNLSHDRLCIPPIDEEFALQALMELIKIDKDWIPKKEGTSLYIRPFTVATEPSLGVHPSQNYKFMIIMSPVGPYYPEGLNPVRIYIEDDYVRAVRGGTGFTKAAANYAVGLKAQEKAKEKNYTQVLWLDGVERKYIEEVGAMNVFFKIGDEVVTPELGGSILAGITRDSVIELLKSRGIKVSQRKVSIDELIAAHEKGELKEAFGTGTAAVISPIGCLYWKEKTYIINDEKTGPLSAEIYEQLTGIQNGRLEDKFGWVKEVK